MGIEKVGMAFAWLLGGCGAGTLLATQNLGQIGMKFPIGPKLNLSEMKNRAGSKIKTNCKLNQF